MRPFRVLRCRTGGWDLCRTSGEARFVGCFPTQGEAIDFAYKTWPWWP